MQPIKILGTGPSGLTAAIALARAGRPVVVYERASDVGTRRDGDLEALENFTLPGSVWDELAQWGVTPNFHYTPIYSLTSFGPGFRGVVRAEDSTPLMYFVTRGPVEGSFDRALLAQAYEAGVQVCFNRPAKPEEADIVAGGMPRARAFAVGYNFRTDGPNGAYVGLDERLTPLAYSYLAICDGRGTVAACALSPRQGMQEILPRVIEGFRSGIEFEMCEPRYFAASITFGLPATARKNGRLYVGEAAELQDVWTGFGMRLGMASGYLAARSLLEGSDYDQLWRARCESLIQAAAVNRMLQTILGNRGYPLLHFLMCRYATRARTLLYRYYNPGRYHTLLWPLARRLLMAQYRRQDAGRLAGTLR